MIGRRNNIKKIVAGSPKKRSNRNELLKIWRISSRADRAANVANVGKAAIARACPKIP
jgi:hypothetical protein